MLSTEQTSIFANAVNHIAANLGRPLLFGPDNKPLRQANYQYSRAASKRTGSLRNWIPKRLQTRTTQIMERERIVERSIDLTNNDPHAAGVVDSFATTVVGPGLVPHPTLDPDVLGMDKETSRRLQAQQRAAYQTWAPFADAGQRMSFGAIQFLVKRCIMQFGEYLVLLPMLTDRTRPFSLACQVIHPMRLKTPVDKVSDKNIRDGVELGSYGEPIAYWIKKADPAAYGRYLADTSANFIRVRAKQGHRWRVLHGFICQDPEQVRGMPFFAPAMKFFRDLNDYLDAELVSNIVTAAFSLFIETAGGTDPYDLAGAFATRTDTGTNADGDEQTTRYQEMIPGQVMYGNTGEKPHPIAANRPGQTFEPFTKVIKKAIAMSLNMPYPVLFKDVENVNFAGFRSAMLDAWRVYSTYRVWLGSGFCQPIFTMLQEEAYLRDMLDVEDFYSRIWNLTRAEWRGAPKGDIEPIKAVKADVLAIQNNLKTRAEAIAERGGDLRTTFDQLEEEQELMREKGLDESAMDDSETDAGETGETRESENGPD